MSKNDNCTTRNLLDLSYHQKYYKSIRIDLSRQKKTSIPQKIKFTGKLEEHDGATKLFIVEQQQTTILNFFSIQ